jgi:hypothetical protein
VLAGLALTASVATGQTGIQTLETENLVAAADGFTSTASCDTASTSTVSWTAQGVATGPYPGTFTASGTLTIGPQTLPGSHPPVPGREGTVAGPLQSFEESFTITSGTTTITGTKSLQLPVASGTLGTCQHVTQFPILDLFDGQGTVVEANASTRYQATISGTAGTSTDSGQAFATLADIQITGSCPAGPTCNARIAGFNETFTLSDRLASIGNSNGGGQVSGPSGPSKVTFAFDARSDQTGMRAACNVIDHLSGRHITCTSIESYTQVGGDVVITGRADDDGVDTEYRIEATDNSEPNAGTDRFTITTGTGYSAGGAVAKGNVQVR